MLEMRFHAFWFVYLLSFCDSSDVFHEGSKITFNPSYDADLFGYALAFSETGLIVGAPNATMSGLSGRTGAVFNCPLQSLETRNVTCTPMKFDKTKDFVDGMWFGASLAVGPTGKMVICAPRWYFTLTVLKDGNETTVMYFHGACYLRMNHFETFLMPMSSKSTSGKQTMEIDNARIEYRDYHLYRNSSTIKYYGLAQVGMAASVFWDTIVLGAPGMLAWSGGIVQYSYKPDEKKTSYTLKPTYNPYYTHDVRPDEYFGYSVESAVFQDGGTILHVAGGPRGKLGFGMVLVFEPALSEVAPLNILAKLSGPQLGSYFGASLRCMDVNADGRTDLLVGAPNYVKQFLKDDFYDQGAVFVYLNKERNGTEEKVKGFVLESAGQLMGSEANGAKFGYSIADLGDIDADGYNDVAISAPWEDNGAGAVYIYGGDKNGFKQEYIQRIVASEAQGFGMGLTKGKDVDHNNCSDLVVGAHESNSAYMYRCIPTVRVQATINVPEASSLSQNTTNFTAQFCVNVLPLRVYPTEIVIEFIATINIDLRGNRAAIDNSSVYIYKVLATPASTNCEEKTIEIKPEADLSRPITLSFDLEPVDRMQANPTQFLNDSGRLTKDSVLHSTTDVQLMSECGEDLICKPWLVMTLEPINEPYIPGAGGKLGAIVRVMNEEEPAFGIHVNMSLPSLPKRVPVTCNLQVLNLTCELPSPFKQNQTAEWEIEFEYIQDMSEVRVAMITVDIDDPVSRKISNTTNLYMEITIELESNITATGKAIPNATVAVSREILDEGRNISFAHYFQVANAGPSDCPDLSASILIPEQVSLRQEIEGCEQSRDSGSLALLCSWSLNAMQSLPIVLSLRYDVGANGQSLEADTTSYVTSTLYLNKQNMTVSITTTFILNPAPQLWIAILVAVLLGFLLLAGLFYVLYKRGFFSRARREAYNELDQDDPNLAEPGPSSVPEQESRSAEDCDESTVFNSSNDPSTSNNMSRLTFRGPSNEPDETISLGPSYASPVTLSESTALYTALRRQLQTDPDIAD